MRSKIFRFFPAPGPVHCRARRFWLAVAALLFATAMNAPFASADSLSTGGFTFSDELGGFRIVSVSGVGSAADPIIVEEELAGTGPAILVIRRNLPGAGDNPWARNGVWTAIYLTKIIHNRSRRVWAGFELELQEHLHQPSVYGDGLSFDQGRAVPVEISSDAFARNHRLYEPFDRIRFHDGSVDPEKTVRLEVHITDPTPVSEFYLVQDPQILFSDRGWPQKFAGQR